MPWWHDPGDLLRWRRAHYCRSRWPCQGTFSIAFLKGFGSVYIILKQKLWWVRLDRTLLFQMFTFWLTCFSQIWDFETIDNADVLEEDANFPMEPMSDTFVGEGVNIISMGKTVTQDNSDTNSMWLAQVWKHEVQNKYIFIKKTVYKCLSVILIT